MNGWIGVNDGLKLVNLDHVEVVERHVSGKAVLHLTSGAELFAEEPYEVVMDRVRALNPPATEPKSVVEDLPDGVEPVAKHLQRYRDLVAGHRSLWMAGNHPTAALEGSPCAAIPCRGAVAVTQHHHGAHAKVTTCFQKAGHDGQSHLSWAVAGGFATSAVLWVADGTPVEPQP